jgi:predicted ATPase/DNA-binding SARP family transcriptional activator
MAFVRVLGPVDVVDDAGVVHRSGSGLQRALLALLALQRGVVHSPDRLMEDLWGDDQPESGVRALRFHVSKLRGAVGTVVSIETRPGGYVLDVGPEGVDEAQFVRLAERSRSEPDDERSVEVAREALRLWRGEPFVDAAPCALLDHEADRLAELRLAVIEHSFERRLAAGAAGELVSELLALVDEHPLREGLWSSLMVAQYRAGRQGDALASYGRLRTTLAETLGLNPSQKLQDLEIRVLRHDPDLDAPAARASVSTGSAVGTDSRPQPVPSAPDIEPVPALRAVEALTISRDPRTVRRALPAERTSFVGRVKELSKAAELLETARLLTLTGPPGSGKTRLALELAARSQDKFPYGTQIVRLAPIADHQLMIETVEDALGLREAPDEAPIDCVKRFLRDREALLVLDNFEHILPAAPIVGELLDAAAELHIIVTSRTPLAIAGEQVFPVPPLAVPDGQIGPAVAADYDAISLFEARARAADPEFVLDPGNTDAVVRIVESVEGLPLAIELAAARVRSLSPEHLARRLTQRLAVLTGGPTDVDRRHRTMRDAIAWSFELLPPEHQALFRRLGVFRGGFTLEAVGPVAECSDAEVFDCVDALVSGGLVQRQVSSPQDRYGMLEMVREFALEMLGAAGERNQAAELHARYHAHLAADVSPSLTRDPRGGGAELLEAEVDNMRAAIRYALDAPEPDLGLQLGADLWRFWQGSHRMTEGRAWLEQLLALPGGSTEKRAGGLTALAGLAYWQADYGTARARYADALEIYRAAGDQLGAAHTVCAMSMSASWDDDLEAGDRLAHEALAAFERIGTAEGLTRAVLARGFVRLRRGDYADAYDDYTTALVAAREQGDQHLAVTLLPGVAASACHLGRKLQALDLAIEAADEAAELHNTNLAVWMLDLIATIVADTEPAAAVSLAGTAAHIRDAAGGGMRIESLGFPNAREIAAGLLSREQLMDSWSTGHRATLEQAIELAHVVRARFAPS